MEPTKIPAYIARPVFRNQDKTYYTENRSMKIMSSVCGLLISSTLIANTQAGEVCYTPQWGTAMTMCTPKFDVDGTLLSPCPEMLGNFHLVLKKVSDGPGKRRLKLAGPMHGVMNPDQTLNHVLGDDRARGLMYTSGDTLVEYIPLDNCLIQVKEELYITLGTAKFTGANGMITVSGELNSCTGVNDFDIEINGDQVCFDQTSLNQKSED
jgi:hypothetical protein